MGLPTTKPVFGVSKKRVSNRSSELQRLARILKFAQASLNMLLSNKRLTKALIRLRGCAGWSAPVLFANLQRQISRAHMMC